MDDKVAHASKIEKFWKLLTLKIKNTIVNRDLESNYQGLWRQKENALYVVASVEVEPKVTPVAFNLSLGAFCLGLHGIYTLIVTRRRLH